MTLYQALCLIGVPTIILGILGYVYAVIRKTIAEIKALKAGMQALLRAQMIDDYNKWGEKEYAPIYARENFENCWNQYHDLGANGVMDDIHVKFLELPTEPPARST